MFHQYDFLCLPSKFMDLRTRYTALVTLTTQHVKYISDALRRLEEEEVGPFLLAVSSPKM